MKLTRVGVDLAKNVVAVAALANKMARVPRAMLGHGMAYQPNGLVA